MHENKPRIKIREQDLAIEIHQHDDIVTVRPEYLEQFVKEFSKAHIEVAIKWSAYNPVRPTPKIP